MLRRAHRHRRTVGITVILSSCVAHSVNAGPPTNAHPRRDSIEELIEQLSDPSFEARTEATRALMTRGPVAIDRLRSAAESDDLEKAIRARHLLHVFDHLLFAGAEIELNPSQSRVAWNEPFDLTIRIHNRTAYPINVPFAERYPKSKSAAVGQVAAQLDVADFLHVTDPDGRPVVLHVDDINDDRVVRQTVSARADHAAQSTVGAHQSRSNTLRAINRGWARYPMLRQGTYRIQLVYQPEWNEEELNHARVGRVESNAVHVGVAPAAPTPIDATGPLSRVDVKRTGGSMVAVITNLSDVPIHVNQNLSPDDPAPYARVRWFLNCGDDRLEIGNVAPVRSNRDFAIERIVAVEPAAHVELSRFAIEAIPVCDNPDVVRSVSATYSNLACRSWQQTLLDNQPAHAPPPRWLQMELPLRMLATTVVSGPVQIATSD